MLLFEEWEGRGKAGIGAWWEGLELCMIYNKEAVFPKKDKGQELKDSQGELWRTAVLM